MQLIIPEGHTAQTLRDTMRKEESHLHWRTHRIRYSCAKNSSPACADHSHLCDHRPLPLSLDRLHFQPYHSAKVGIFILNLLRS